MQNNLKILVEKLEVMTKKKVILKEAMPLKKPMLNLKIYVGYVVGISGNEKFPSGGDVYKAKAKNLKTAMFQMWCKHMQYDLTNKEHIEEDKEEFNDFYSECAKKKGFVIYSADDTEGWVFGEKGKLTSQIAKSLLRAEFGEDDGDDW